MQRNLWSFAVAIVLVSFAWADPHGTAPRSEASQYPAHAEQAGTVNIGARMLTRSEVLKTFVSDLNRCCVVIELAMFPQNGKSLAISLHDISVRVDGAKTAARPASASVISATLQKSASQDRDVTISPVTTIGYQTGRYYDPAAPNESRSRGVYTSAGVGVGVNQGSAGASDQDRKVMETELNEKGLPEGTVTDPVAGYIYFPIAPKKNAHYQLEYKVNGAAMSLTLQ